MLGRDAADVQSERRGDGGRGACGADALGELGEDRELVGVLQYLRLESAGAGAAAG